MRRLEKRRSISGVGFLTEIQEKKSTGTLKKERPQCRKSPASKSLKSLFAASEMPHWVPKLDFETLHNRSLCCVRLLTGGYGKWLIRNIVRRFNKVNKVWFSAALLDWASFWKNALCFFNAIGRSNHAIVFLVPSAKKKINVCNFKRLITSEFYIRTWKLSVFLYFSNKNSSLKKLSHRLHHYVTKEKRLFVLRYKHFEPTAH